MMWNRARKQNVLWGNDKPEDVAYKTRQQFTSLCRLTKVVVKNYKTIVAWKSLRFLPRDHHVKPRSVTHAQFSKQAFNKSSSIQQALFNISNKLELIDNFNVNVDLLTILIMEIKIIIYIVFGLQTINTR
jgi:hypothetical protein